jgi:TatD DNase family protein
MLNGTVLSQRPPVTDWSLLGTNLTDCHTHLDRYPRATVREMVLRASAAGVAGIILAGTTVASSRRCVQLTKQHLMLMTGVGLHPNHVRGRVPERTYLALARLAAEPGVVCWSECGLDYREGTASPRDQRRAFGRQLEIARGCGLAAIVHVVDAVDDALAMLTDADMAGRAVIHYFVGDQALAERYLTAGLYLSVGKPATRPANVALRAAIRATPLDRLLVETDTYPLPGRTTEPADVARVAAAVADLHGVAFETVARAEAANLGHLRRARPPDLPA